RALSVVERKNVQKCLRYGSYTGKVDGIWGTETFRALKNFQINSSNDTDRDNGNGDISVIAKIKNLFSRKKSCYELVSKNFKI
ncbi:peptidoglycan-binding protein, partial [Planktomarina temperata]|nr:peptidoglycan-binding protein [Planktomarina temperata]